MTTISIEEAQSRLAEVIDHLAAGERIVILRGDRPIAWLGREAEPPAARRQPGSAQGKLTILVEDDEHLQGFEDGSL